MNLAVFTTFPVLQGSRIHLIRHEFSHASEIHKMRTDPAVMRYMDAPLSISVNDVQSKIKVIRDDFDRQIGINWIIRELETEAILGVVSIWKIDHKNNRGEIGYTLKKSHWGRGIASEAVSLVIDFAFQEADLHTLCANINPNNNRSRELLERLEFCKEAHFRQDYYYNGQYLDSHIYGLIASEWLAKRRN